MNCPNCGYEYPYPDGEMMVCPDCQNQWDPNAAPVIEVQEIKRR